MSADKPTWDDVSKGQLYVIAGTRILAITFGNDASLPIVGGFFTSASSAHIIDESGHGTKSAGMVVRQDPGAIIVMIQVNERICNPGAGCLVDPSIAAGMEWAAAQPWIDIISVSLRVPGDPPTHPAIGPEQERYLKASRAAAASGKLVVNIAGNEATPTFPSYFGGPPWTITIGGFEAQQHGERPEASKGVDVVANYTQYVPSHQSLDGYEWATGTSFACPEVAGVLSRALHDVRSQLHSSSVEGGFPVVGMIPGQARVEITAKAFRDALNASARLVGPTEWDPTKPTSNETSPLEAGFSLPVLVQPAQTGWGYVDGSVAAQIVERALNPMPLPEGKALAATYQAQYQALREQYWSMAP